MLIYSTGNNKQAFLPVLQTPVGRVCLWRHFGLSTLVVTEGYYPDYADLYCQERTTYAAEG